MLSLVRELIALRRELGDGFELLDAPDGMVAFRRGRFEVAVNPTSEPLPTTLRGEPRLETVQNALHDGMLIAHGGVVVKD